MSDVRYEWRPAVAAGRRFAAALAAAILVLGICTYHDGAHLKLAVEAAIAAGLVLVCARHVAAALGVLVVFLPLQVVGLAWLYHAGLPAAVIRGLGSVKDIVVLGAVLAAVRAAPAVRRRLDLVDVLLVGYIAIATLYLFLPRLFPGHLTLLPLTVTSLAWRGDVSFALLILALRHVPIGAAARRRVELTIVSIGVVVAACGYWEYFATSGWERFLTQDLHVPEYLTQILHSSDQLIRRTTVGTTAQVRPGSLLFEPVILGFYLLLPLGLLLRGVSSRRSLLAVPALLLVAGCLVLTLTRSAVLSGMVMVVVFAWYATAGRHRGRARLLILVGVIAVASIPVAGVTKLSQRTTSATNGTDVSASVHSRDLQRGIDRIKSQPLGAGLGTVAGVGAAYQVANHLVSENAYLQVGDEMGIVELVVFAGLLLALLAALHRRARAPGPGADRAAAAAAILVALIVGGFLQEVWIGYPQTLTAAAILGLAGSASSPRFIPGGEQEIDH